MKYLQVTISTVSEGSELVAMVLYDAGSDGVSIVDNADIRELIEKKLNWDYVDERLLQNAANKALVSGYFSCDFDLGVIYDAIDELRLNSVVPLGSLEITANTISSSDWENEWRKYYAPIELGKITIVPAWQKAPEDGSIPVYIEPGMAFGTGNHETTSMCVELMQRLNLDGKEVLDMGCGSGILGIAAAKLGAGRVVLSDIDEQAVKASKENATLNGVAGVCEIVAGDLNCGKVRADVVIANITADILLRLKNQLDSALKDGGYMIISGIIHTRLAEVVSGYSDGFEIVEEKKNGEWNALLLKKLAE